MGMKARVCVQERKDERENQTKPRNMGVDDGVISSKQKPETIYMSNKTI